MSPLRYLPTPRDVSASASPSAFPSPTMSLLPYASGVTVHIPNWIGYVGIAIFGLIVLVQFYYAFKGSGEEQSISAPKSKVKVRSFLIIFCYDSD
jgi:hypothetical protein